MNPTAPAAQSIGVVSPTSFPYSALPVTENGGDWLRATVDGLTTNGGVRVTVNGSRFGGGHASRNNSHFILIGGNSVHPGARHDDGEL